MARRIAGILVALLVALPAVPRASAGQREDVVRIGWQWRERKLVCRGAYARVRRLADGSLALVYGASKNVYIAKSVDGGKTWGKSILVATDAQGKYDYTNSELAQLAGGRLVYSWNARPLKDTNLPYKIMLSVSDDGGKTWGVQKTIYTAGTDFHDGCWEPYVMQLPSGEVQLYYSDEHNIPDERQNISVIRSFDGGNTWGTPEVVSFRSISRDGMPVAVWLPDGSGIAMAIEDNGMNGTFKPAIIFTSASDNWHSGIVDGESRRRWSALAPSQALPRDVYGGAPYLVALKGGGTLLSIQSGEGRRDSDKLDYALMQVYSGDSHAKDFKARTTPFANHANPDVHELWNSLEQIDDNTVMAVSSLGGIPKRRGIWTVTGKIMRRLESVSSQSSADFGSSAFIGSASQAYAEVSSRWDEQTVEFNFCVTDSNIVESDGVELYIRTKKKNIYRITANAGKHTECFRFTDGKWKSVDLPGEFLVGRQSGDKYMIGITVPWKSIGGKPRKGWADVCFSLNNLDGDNFTRECLAGADENKPDTWMRCVFAGKP
jgi:hypothetical protein